MHGFERCELALSLLQYLVPLVDESRQFLILLTQFSDVLTNFGKVPVKFIPRLPLAEFAIRQLIISRLQRLRIRNGLRIGQFALSFHKTLQPRLDLLGARFLHVLRLQGLVIRLRVRVPLLLPVHQRILREAQRLG